MILLLMITLILLDQITKYLAKIYLFIPDTYITLIPNILHLQYLENTGVAFGMFKGFFYIINIITSIIILILIYFLIKLLSKNYIILSYVIAILISGAIGNMIDRVYRGYVIDFIYFIPTNFPIFNLADAYVSISVILLIYLLNFKYKNLDFWEILKNE